MPVKVVSDGPVKTRKLICENCCYELEYTPADVSEKYSRDWDGGGDTYYWIVCPRLECNYKNYLKEKFE